MAIHDSTTTAFIPIINNALENKSKPGVSARALHEALGLNPTVYARWAKKNIVHNDFAMEHSDWDIILHEVEYSVNQRVKGHFSQDYVLTIDFAKRLAMMARSTKGEEVRQYFLECERRAQEQASPKLPVLHDPAYQMLLQAVIDLDATRHVLAQVNAKADLALTQQQWITLRQYVFVNKLTRQLPPARMTEYGKWLTGYCVERNIPVSREPVADRPYDAENRYHVGTIEATLPGWLQRRDGQAALRILPGPEQN